MTAATDPAALAARAREAADYSDLHADSWTDPDMLRDLAATVESLLNRAADADRYEAALEFIASLGEDSIPAINSSCHWHLEAAQKAQAALTSRLPSGRQT
jgi:hypothetical protein